MLGQSIGGGHILGDSRFTDMLHAPIRTRQSVRQITRARSFATSRANTLWPVVTVEYLAPETVVIATGSHRHFGAALGNADGFDVVYYI